MESPSFEAAQAQKQYEDIQSIFNVVTEEELEEVTNQKLFYEEEEQKNTSNHNNGSHRNSGTAIQSISGSNMGIIATVGHSASQIFDSRDFKVDSFAESSKKSVFDPAVEHAALLPKRRLRYRTSPFRWFILAQYSLSVTSSAFIMMNFSPISQCVASIFEVGQLVVNFNVMIFLICFVVFNFLSVQALEKNMCLTFKISASMIVVGAWSRWAAIAWTGNFYFLTACQTLIAIPQPFLANGASKLATVWFADEERALATAVGSLSIPFGCIFGLVMGPLFIPDGDKFNHELGRQDMNTYMLVSAFIVTIMNASLIFFYKDKPEFFPSKVARTNTAAKFSMIKDAKLMIVNKNYIILLICYSLLYGVYTCLGAVINNLVVPYGFTSGDASIFGAVFIVSGLIGSFVFSGFLDKYNAYLKILRIVCFGSLFFATMMIISLSTGKVWLTTINISFLGFFILPIIPVSYSFAVELTFPVAEAMSNGTLMLFSQLLGVIDTTLATQLAVHHASWCIILFVAQILLACVCSLFLKEDLRRIGAQKRALEQANLSNKPSVLDKDYDPNEFYGFQVLEAASVQPYGKQYQ